MENDLHFISLTEDIKDDIDERKNRSSNRLQAICGKFLGYLIDTETYRPILAILLLVLNIISYKEDPTSYSWTKFKNPAIGYTYNHLFTKYSETYDVSGKWLVFKLFLLTLYPLTVAIAVEFFFRRLVLWRLLRCSGFKRDKGAMIVFILSLSLGLYTGAVLYNTAVHNAEYLGDAGTLGRALHDYYYAKDDWIGDLDTLDNATLPSGCTFEKEAIRNAVGTMKELITISNENPKNVRFDLIYCGFRYADLRFGNTSSDTFFDAINELDPAYNDDMYRSHDFTDRELDAINCIRQLFTSLGIKMEPDDPKHEKGGYCYYLWTNVLNIDVENVIETNAILKNNDETKIESLLLDDDIYWLTEGLFNRLSSLVTFICCSWTLFAVVDEHLQKRGWTRYRSRRASNAKHEYPLSRNVCDWFNMRVQFFWFYFFGVFLLSILHVAASVNYHSFGHRCQELSYDDFDTNVTFNSIFVNLYEGNQVPQTFFHDERSTSAYFNVSFLGYDAISFETEYYQNTSFNFSEYSKQINDTDTDGAAKYFCQNFWNDKHVYGFSKNSRIVLSVIILSLDLILELFVSDFPAFQNDVKVYNKSLNLKQLVFSQRSVSDKKDEEMLQWYSSICSFLREKSIVYANRRNIFMRTLLACIPSYCNASARKEVVYTDYFLPFIPGLTTTDVEVPSLGDLCKCVKEKKESKYESNLRGKPASKWVDILCCRPSYSYDDYKGKNPNYQDSDISFGTSSESDDSGYNTIGDDDDTIMSKIDDKMRLMCCFCCYESCARKRKGKSDRKKTAITAKWLMYGALTIATLLNMLSLVQQCSFEPVYFDQIETMDGSLHQLNNLTPNDTTAQDKANLCMVCPKSIRKKSNPLNDKIETWYPMFETVEWVDLNTISDFGDITKSYTENKMDYTGSCFLSFGENLWFSETNICDSWNKDSDISPSFDGYREFDLGNETCIMKKKIKWKCGCSGYHQHESESAVSYDDVIVKERNEDGEFFRLNPAFTQRDCNFDRARGASAFWRGDNYTQERERSRRWYFDKSSPKHQKHDSMKSTYCLKMDVLEWLEVLCVEKTANSPPTTTTTFTKERLDTVYDIAQLEQVSKDILYNYDFDCIACASKTMKHPSYLEAFENAPTFNYAETSWGLESSNVFKNRYFWVGDISDRGDWYERYFYPKNLKYYKNNTDINAFGIRKSSISCKITTCPIGSYNTYNNEKNVENALYLTIFPLFIAIYMLWIACWNHLVELGFKFLYNLFPNTKMCQKIMLDGDFYDQNDLDIFETFKKRHENDLLLKKKIAMHKIVIRLGLCMSCKCRRR